MAVVDKERVQQYLIQTAETQRIKFELDVFHGSCGIELSRRKEDGMHYVGVLFGADELEVYYRQSAKRTTIQYRTLRRLRYTESDTCSFISYVETAIQDLLA